MLKSYFKIIAASDVSSHRYKQQNMHRLHYEYRQRKRPCSMIYLIMIVIATVYYIGKFGEKVM